MSLRDKLRKQLTKQAFSGSFRDSGGFNQWAQFDPRRTGILGYMASQRRQQHPAGQQPQMQPNPTRDSGTGVGHNAGQYMQQMQNNFPQNNVMNNLGTAGAKPGQSLKPMATTGLAGKVNKTGSELVYKVAQYSAIKQADGDGFFRGAGNFISNAVSNARSGIARTSVGRGVRNAAQGIRDTGRAIGTGISNRLSSTGGGIRDGISSGLSTIGQGVSNFAGNAVNTGVDMVRDTARSAVRTGLGTVGGVADRALRGTSNIVGDMPQRAIGAVARGTEAAAGGTRGAMDTVAGGIESAGQRMADHGQKALAGVNQSNNQPNQPNQPIAGN